MNRLMDIYREIRRNRWSTAALYASIIVVGLSAAKILGVIVIGILALLTTSSAFAVALMVIAYLIYRGGRSVWQDHRAGESEE